MGIKVKFFSLLALAGLFAGSCKGPGGDDPETPGLTVSPASLSVEALGGTVSFSVVSGTDDWLARSDQNWAKVSPVSGKAGTSAVTVSVSVDENTTTSSRTATVTVKTLGTESRTVVLTQSQGSGEPTVKGISSAADLQGFAKALAEGGPVSPYLVNGVPKLLCDIDASSIKDWIPIGTSGAPLTSGFDGDGHKITGLCCVVDLAAYPLAGFIGNAKGGTVKNLTIEGEMTFRGSPSSEASIGGVVGNAAGVAFENVKCGLKLSVTDSQQKSAAVGGIAGRTDSSCKIGNTEKKAFGCSFSGEILVPSACYEGGLAGYNEGVIANCTNTGSILGKDAGDGQYGPGWGCGFNRLSASFTANNGYGHVGDYDSFKSKPESAPDATFMNCMVCKAYDVLENTVDQTLDAYYDWKEVTSFEVSSGVKYSHFDCTGVPRHVHVLEVDLSNPAVEVTTSYAEDCVPNPNGNKNSNNGKNIRETLSEVCSRMRGSGDNIVAGINSGFFDSNDGISRGYHIQDGEPVYGSYYIWSRLTNHKWAFTVFTDGTASCGKKTFTARLMAGGKEYTWYSVNDTTLRHTTSTYPVNIFSSRYKQYPHPENKSLVNNLAPDALYVIAEYTGENMKVNCGYAEAKVKAIHDGRNSPLSTLPYLSNPKEVGISLCDVPAAEVGSAVKVGDIVKLKFDMTIADQTYGNLSKPVLTQNSTMYEFIANGKDVSSSSGIVSHDPMTFPAVSQDGKKIWLVEVDGRQGWYSTGLNAYEIYRIAKKLGAWNATRFDGGGSSCMWVYDKARGSGSLVNRVSDSKGERSCLNYLLIRAKQ